MTYNVDMLFLISWLTKFFSKFIKIFHLGNGYTWPGHLVQKIYPAIWKKLKENKDSFFSKGIVFISGTNGKTTTSALLTHLLRSSGYSVTHNASGANLLNGILTSILLRTNFFGRVVDDFAVFEVDEFNLPFLLEKITPDYLLLTSLSRDQLDRYGEIATIMKRWLDALKNIITQESEEEFKPSLIVNSSDEGFSAVVDLYKKYGVDVISFSDDTGFLKYTLLVGSFNARNVNAAVTAASELGVDRQKIPDYLKNFEPAFGRGERVAKFGKEFYIFLAKNPASLNNNLKMLFKEKIGYDSLLFILNDKIPDGRDVSWIYDIEPDFLRRICEGHNVYVSGTRFLDMQIRLDYAGVDSAEQVFDLNRENLVELKGQRIMVLPNYSAMLEFRQLITGSDIL